MDAHALLCDQVLWADRLHERIDAHLFMGDAQGVYDLMAKAIVVETWCIPESVRPTHVCIPCDFVERLWAYRVLRSGRARHIASERRTHSNLSRVCENLARRMADLMSKNRELEQQAEQDRRRASEEREAVLSRMERASLEHVRETAGLRTELAAARIQLERERGQARRPPPSLFDPPNGSSHSYMPTQALPPESYPPLVLTPSPPKDQVHPDVSASRPSGQSPE